MGQLTVGHFVGFKRRSVTVVVVGRLFIRLVGR